MLDKSRNLLLLVVKSLAQNRKQKDYTLHIENHSGYHKFDIQNVFTHNYQYVYELWPCRTSSSQPIRIKMFERTMDEPKTLIKIGEATPLVRCSQEGQRYQFYGSKHSNCVLILTFKVLNELNTPQQRSYLQMLKQNKSLQKQVKKNQNQQANFKDSFQQSQHFHEYQDHPQQMLLRQDDNQDQKYNKTQTSDLKYDPPRKIGSIKLQKHQTRQTKQKSHLYSHDISQHSNQLLSRKKYLSSTIELDNVEPSSESQSSIHIQIDSAVRGKKKNQSQRKRQLKLANQMIKLPYEIKRRREKYLGQQVQTSLEKPSQLPLASYEATLHPQQMAFQIQKQRNNTQPSNIIDFKQSFARKQNHTKIKQQQGCLLAKQTLLNKQLQNQNSQTQRILKNVQKKLNKPSFSIIRTQNFPLHDQGNKYRKNNDPPCQKIVASKKTAQHNNDEKFIAKNNDNLSFQPNITHYSIHSKPHDKQHQKKYNIMLFNFKTVLYAGNIAYPKKLVIIFEDSKYSTSIINYTSITTEWSQRFYIKNCNKKSFVHFKLISVDRKQYQEGQNQTTVGQIMACAIKIYRSYFFRDGLAVGYLEFQFEKNQSKAGQGGWRRQSQRNTISLPQLKKKESRQKLLKSRNSLKKVEKDSDYFSGKGIKYHKNDVIINKRSVHISKNQLENSKSKDGSIQIIKQKFKRKMRQKNLD